jgi:hypothetical protein
VLAQHRLDFFEITLRRNDAAAGCPAAADQAIARINYKQPLSPDRLAIAAFLRRHSSPHGRVRGIIPRQRGWIPKWLIRLRRIGRRIMDRRLRPVSERRLIRAAPPSGRNKPKFWFRANAHTVPTTRRPLLFQPAIVNFICSIRSSRARTSASALRALAPLRWRAPGAAPGSVHARWRDRWEANQRGSSPMMESQHSVPVRALACRVDSKHRDHPAAGTASSRQNE